MFGLGFNFFGRFAFGTGFGPKGSLEAAALAYLSWTQNMCSVTWRNEAPKNVGPTGAGATDSEGAHVSRAGQVLKKQRIRFFICCIAECTLHLPYLPLGFSVRWRTQSMRDRHMCPRNFSVYARREIRGGAQTRKQSTVMSLTREEFLGHTGLCLFDRYPLFSCCLFFFSWQFTFNNVYAELSIPLFLSCS